MVSGWENGHCSHEKFGLTACLDLVAKLYWDLVQFMERKREVLLHIVEP